MSNAHGCVSWKLFLTPQESSTSMLSCKIKLFFSKNSTLKFLPKKNNFKRKIDSKSNSENKREEEELN